MHISSTIFESVQGIMNENPFDRGVKGRALPTVSLDDLVEDNLTSENNSRDDGEEDELDAYMAMITAQEDTSNKRQSDGRLQLEDDDIGNAEENVQANEEKVENLEADLAAAIAGTNASVTKTTKKLSQLSERKVTYMPFRKNFYVEVPELAKLSEDEVKEMRLSLENIKVTGKNIPKPAMCWAHCGLSRKIMEVLKKLKFNSPTPVQAQAIPAIMSGRDVIGIAKTGCGKTLSFLLPMFRHILDQPKLEKGEGPIAVIITPTRELATQICDDAQKFTKVLGLRIVPVYGGPNISEQIGLLKPGAEIVVCTPGRMIEVLTVNSGRVTNLNRCTFLVLDEADRLFDMGFEKQIRSIVDLIRPDRQTVMFSATFPKIMEAHARRIMTKPVEIEVGGRSIVCKDVHQTVEIIEEDDKFLRLISILQNHVDHTTSAIVFVAKQEKADSLLEDLMQAYDPNCLVLHGGIDKDDRISTFANFKSGQSRVLVATSVAARGLDVKNCICVVNYDCPNHYEDYVHRCGRTGRAGNKGFAFTFITPEQGPYAADIIKALELSGNKVPSELQNLWDTYKEESEKLGKKVWTSSGFSGRGFKFDEAEAKLISDRKNYQKKSLGLQNSDDEDEDGTGAAALDSDAEVDAATLESEIKNLAGIKSSTTKFGVGRVGSNSKSSPKKAKAEPAVTPSVASTSSAPVEASPSPATTVIPSSSSTLPPEIIAKLEMVQKKAAAILRSRGIEIPLSQPVKTSSQTDAPSPSLVSTSVAGSVASTNIARQIAEQKTQALRSKLGHPIVSQHPVSASLTLGETIEKTDPLSAQLANAPTSNASAVIKPVSERSERLEMKFEINDFHQQVRRRLTSKEALARISELCEVGITVRGQFCQHGDIPREPKLYLAIEGKDPDLIEKARIELLVLVKDEYTRINSQSSRGRYRLL